MPESIFVAVSIDGHTCPGDCACDALAFIPSLLPISDGDMES